MPEFSHNWGAAAAGQLRALVERIERLEDEKKTIATDIREVFAEAKSNGFDVKIMRQVIRLRKQDSGTRAEEEAIRDLYMSALGMKADQADIEDYTDSAGVASAEDGGASSGFSDGDQADNPPAEEVPPFEDETEEVVQAAE